MPHNVPYCAQKKYQKSFWRSTTLKCEEKKNYRYINGHFRNEMLEFVLRFLIVDFWLQNHFELISIGKMLQLKEREMKT